MNSNKLNSISYTAVLPQNRVAKVTSASDDAGEAAQFWAYKI